MNLSLTASAQRVEAIAKALEIVSTARASVCGSSPAAWEFLYRVSRYLSRQQEIAFAELMR